MIKNAFIAVGAGCISFFASLAFFWKITSADVLEIIFMAMIPYVITALWTMDKLECRGRRSIRRLKRRRHRKAKSLTFVTLDRKERAA